MESSEPTKASEPPRDALGRVSVYCYEIPSTSSDGGLTVNTPCITYVLPLRLPCGGTALILGTNDTFPESIAHVEVVIEGRQPAVVLLEGEHDGLLARRPSSTTPFELHKLGGAQLGFFFGFGFHQCFILHNAGWKLASAMLWLGGVDGAFELLQAALGGVFIRLPGAVTQQGDAMAREIGAAVVRTGAAQSVALARLQQLLALGSLCRGVAHAAGFGSVSPPPSSLPPNVRRYSSRAAELYARPLAVAKSLWAEEPVSEAEFAHAALALRPALQTTLRMEVAAAIAQSLKGEASLLDTLGTVLDPHRDLLLARAIRRQRVGPGECVVAVVGAEHLAGIARVWFKADSPDSDALAASIVKPQPLTHDFNVAAYVGKCAAEYVGAVLLAASVFTRRGRRGWVGVGAAAMSWPVHAVAGYAALSAFDRSRGVYGSAGVEDSSGGGEWWALPRVDAGSAVLVGSAAAAAATGLLCARYRPVARAAALLTAGALCYGVLTVRAAAPKAARVAVELKRLVRATAPAGECDSYDKIFGSSA